MCENMFSCLAANIYGPEYFSAAMQQKTAQLISLYRRIG